MKKFAAAILIFTVFAASDILFAGNDDYSTAYLCELKNGTLEVRTTLKMPYFTSWNLKGEIPCIS